MRLCANLSAPENPESLQKSQGVQKTRCFFGPLKNAGRDSGIFDAILVGFALPFVEISMDVAAK